MNYCVNIVDWHSQKALLQKIREQVFVCELHMPKKIEFDHLDTLAQHILVTHNSQLPVATARLCPDGLIGRLAVLPKHRNRVVYQYILDFIVSLAVAQKIEVLSINCILNEVERFKKNGFTHNGAVFMEAGIPRQRMQCKVSCFQTDHFTLVH